MSSDKYAVGILIFDGVELLDFAGPYEVLSVARDSAGGQPFSVHLVASSAAVQVTGGMRVQRDFNLEECPALDVLIVPGGKGVRTLVQDRQLLEWVAERSKSAQITASVCTGALLLGKAGLLRGLPATTHWKSLDWMQRELPATTVERTKRIVDCGRIVTCAGISAGIDMALGIAARLLGPDAAIAAAAEMEYRWVADDYRGNTAGGQ